MDEESAGAIIKIGRDNLISLALVYYQLVNSIAVFPFTGYKFGA
ncbi:hypothetical protein [Cedecea sp. P7760]|nr:hypothetical protein [Cedecea sp. P7760]